MPLLPFGRRDLVGDGQSVVLLVLSPVSARGGLVGVVSLRFCCGLVPHKDGSNRLLTGGVVSGDVHELASGVRLLAP